MPPYAASAENVSALRATDIKPLRVGSFTVRIGISNDISRELALYCPYFGRSTARSQAINPPLH
jgi:hypothetical protein